MACPDGKQSYPSRQVALNAAWLVGLACSSDQGAYVCRHPQCGKWHLTRDPEAERPRAKPGGRAGHAIPRLRRV
jgi:hypothetical protein